MNLYLLIYSYLLWEYRSSIFFSFYMLYHAGNFSKNMIQKITKKTDDTWDLCDKPENEIIN